MTSSEARKMLDHLRKTLTIDEMNTEKVNELLKIIIEEDKDVYAMSELGSRYYCNKDFDLALKYYSMAAEYGMNEIYSSLGYIWYYGRTGVVDYKQAYECFYKVASINPDCLIDRNSMAAIEATIKIADMYKNGYFVEKDEQKYKEIIKGIYERIDDLDFFELLPEVYTRLASIYKEEGNKELALSLLQLSKECLANRLLYNDFFGDFTRMKYCISDLYSLTDFNEEEFDFYDMYYLLKDERTVKFWYDGKSYQVRSVKNDSQMNVEFNGKWFKTIGTFFREAMIGDYKLCYIQDDFDNFAIVK